MKYAALLERLDAEGRTGCDLSPGEPWAKEAAAAIRELLAEAEA
jgi:hypothetical protein